jgi:hypothetical protein
MEFLNRKLRVANRKLRTAPDVWLEEAFFAGQMSHACRLQVGDTADSNPRYSTHVFRLTKRPIQRLAGVGGLAGSGVGITGRRGAFVEPAAGRPRVKGSGWPITIALVPGMVAVPTPCCPIAVPKPCWPMAVPLPC